MMQDHPTERAVLRWSGLTVTQLRGRQRRGTAPKPDKDGVYNALELEPWLQTLGVHNPQKSRRKRPALEG